MRLIDVLISLSLLIFITGVTMHVFVGIDSICTNSILKIEKIHNASIMLNTFYEGSKKGKIQNFSLQALNESSHKNETTESIEKLNATGKKYFILTFTLLDKRYIAYAGGQN